MIISLPRSCTNILYSYICDSCYSNTVVEGGALFLQPLVSISTSAVSLFISYPSDYHSFWAGFPGSSLFLCQAMPSFMAIIIFLEKTSDHEWIYKEINKQMDECYPSFCKTKALACSVVLRLLYLLRVVVPIQNT